jgi:hypothetical protein
MMRWAAGDKGFVAAVRYSKQLLGTPRDDWAAHVHAACIALVGLSPDDPGW